MNTFNQASSAPAGAKPSAFYFRAWRWHFYSGLFVVPFLLILAITGTVMVYFTGFQDRLGQLVHVTGNGPTKPLGMQAQAVLQKYPKATIAEYVSPKENGLSAWFIIANEGVTLAVAVNPYTAEVIKEVDKENTLYAWAAKIHRKLLLGDTGDRIVEIASGLAVVQLVTGLYLFWPRNGGKWGDILMPDFAASGRKLWKTLHTSVGFYISIVLLVFLISGHAWTGIWGAKFVQPWNSFPAAKWDAPKSDLTHASLNTADLREVPWGLEQTPLPVSGSDAGQAGVPEGKAVNLDGVFALAQTLGFSGQFHVAVPQDENGVYSISADTMSGDLKVPNRDRTVHVDRYSGKILADIQYADYPLMAKAMAVGIALHQGDLGLWNAGLNIALTSCIAFLCVSGVVMWWKRRPVGTGRLGAPLMPAESRLWKGGVLAMVITGMAFPLAGIAMVLAFVLDTITSAAIPAVRGKFN